MQKIPDAMNITLPIGSTYLDEALRIAKAAVNEQISALDPEKRKKVADACTELSLGEESIRTALATTCDLIDFELCGRQAVMTDAQRFECIKYLRDVASELAEVMDVLPLNDKLALMSAFRSAKSELEDVDSIHLDYSSVPTSKTFKVMGIAAQKILDQRPDDEGKGGRRSLLVDYSRFIQSLAVAFDEEKLPVGRGGSFERLCTVVFETAGVRATSEGAIRYYLSNRNKSAPATQENSGK